MLYLIREFSKEKKLRVTWIFTETGHGKGPMDGVGAVVKTAITNTIAYNPQGVIRNTEQLLNYLPPFQNIKITTYDEEEHQKNVEILPKQIKNLKIFTKCGFGIGKVHEYTINQSELIYWKQTSSDDVFAEAKIIVSSAPWTQRTADEQESSDGILYILF